MPNVLIQMHLMNWNIVRILVLDVMIRGLERLETAKPLDLQNQVLRAYLLRVGRNERDRFVAECRNGRTNRKQVKVFCLSCLPGNTNCSR